MKKLLLIALLIVGCGFAQNTKFDTTSINIDKSITKDSLNWRFASQLSTFLVPVVSMNKRNDEGDIKGFRGIRFNMTGYYSKNYLKPLKVNSWNYFWTWGTMFFAPFIGAGTEYINTDGFYFGIGIDSFIVFDYDIPSCNFGKYF